jgi:hypothetical protein
MATSPKRAIPFEPSDPPPPLARTWASTSSTLLDCAGCFAHEWPLHSSPSLRTLANIQLEQPSESGGSVEGEARSHAGVHGEHWNATAGRRVPDPGNPIDVTNLLRDGYALREFSRVTASPPSRHPRLARQQSRVDPRRLERGGPALVARRVEQDGRVGARREPAVAGHFLVELALAPPGIAERHDPLLGAPPLGDRAQHVDRPGHREQLAILAVDVERILPAPVARMDHEPASGLDRAAVVDRAVRRLARVDLELPQQPAEGDSRALVADADPDRAVFVMRAHRDHRPLEPRIRHPGHCQQQLAGQEIGLLDHCFDHGPRPGGGQELSRAHGRPKARLSLMRRSLNP